MAIKPTKEQIKQLMSADMDRPVVMLNLLKYAPKASGDNGAQGLTGEQSYERYGQEVQAMLKQTGGRLLWRGKADSVVIGGDGDEWDEVLLVEYPSRKAFLAMTSAPDYQKTGEHRTAALADSRLIAMTELFRHAGATGA